MTETTTPTAPLEVILLPSEDSTALVQVQPAKVQALFLEPTLMDAVLAYVERQAMNFTPDLSTAAGRKRIASQAYTVAQTKTYLDGLGKALVDELKKQPAQIDATRKRMRDTLDSIKDRVRQDLTKWEEHQEALKARVTAITNLPTRHFTSTSAVLTQALAELEATDPATFENLEQDAASAKMVTRATLEEMLQKRLKWEADQLELERLRKEEAERKQREAERKQREAEEALRKEGEERARKAALERGAAITMEGHPQHAAATAAPQVLTTPPIMPPVTVDPTLPPNTVVFKQDGVEVGRMVNVAAPAPVPQDWRSIPEEQRRPINREALDDLLAVLNGDETTAKAVLQAIVLGKVRHIAITY